MLVHEPPSDFGKLRKRTGVFELLSAEASSSRLAPVQTTSALLTKSGRTTPGANNSENAIDRRPYRTLVTLALWVVEDRPNVISERSAAHNACPSVLTFAERAHTCRKNNV